MTVISRNDPIRRTVFYGGKVQGVGFRATACSLASRHEVTGYVKNLDDGEVELVAEGDYDEVHRFLDSLTNTFGACIQESRHSTSPGTGEFKSFGIRY